jgi:hypothetical protein
VFSPTGDVARPGLRQDARSPSTWRTTWWPREEGWHRVGETDSALWTWVAAAERWPTLRLAERQQATATRLAGATAASRSMSAAVAPPPLRPLPRGPVFALLLVALALLWGEELARRTDCSKRGREDVANAANLLS